MNRMPVAIRSAVVHLPDLLPDALPMDLRPQDSACSPEEAHRLLGRKGLLLKESATVLALCAAHRAMGLPPGRPLAPPHDSAETAVVASSNLGNIETVCEMAAAVHAHDYHQVSPLATPNASSNVLASTVAIRFGLRGPNVMLCNGATSGADAIRVAARLLHARRARRVLVVAAESDDEVAQVLLTGHAATVPKPHALTRAAAALVLEADPDPLPGTVLLGGHGSLAPGSPVTPLITATHAQLTFAPHAHRGESADPRTIDLTARLGETYGAHGLLQAALAVHWLHGADTPERPRSAVRAICGDSHEGHTWLDLERAPARHPTTAVPAQHTLPTDLLDVEVATTPVMAMRHA